MKSKINLLLLLTVKPIQQKQALLALLTLLVLLLSACSPHPAAHTWVSQDKNNLGISKITVVFEGTADFYSASDDQSIRRCFWGAKSRNSIELNCVDSNNTDIKETYEFEVIDDGTARLTRDKSLITQLTRQSIRDEELKQIEEQKKKQGD